MSATVAVIAATTAQTAAANAAAQEAARTACMTYVRGYQSDRATVAEMREYANCVDLLHPEPMAVGDLLVWKAIVVVLLAGMVAGAVNELRRPAFGPIESALMGGFMGLCASVGGLLAIAGVWFGVKLLLM